MYPYTGATLHISSDVHIILSMQITQLLHKFHDSTACAKYILRVNNLNETRTTDTSESCAT